MRSPSPSDVHHDATDEVNSGTWRAFLPLHILWAAQSHPSLTPHSNTISVNRTFGHSSLTKCKVPQTHPYSFLGHVSPSVYLPVTTASSSASSSILLSIHSIHSGSHDCSPGSAWGLLNALPSTWEAILCTGNILTLKYSYINLVISNLFWFPNAKYLPNWNLLARPRALSIIQLQSVIPPFSTLPKVNSPLSSVMLCAPSCCHELNHCAAVMNWCMDGTPVKQQRYNFGWFGFWFFHPHCTWSLFSNIHYIRYGVDSEVID